ncbi:hypothetical protein GIB67_035142 [Kingdonia uniflora]|uniref:HTH three-helical bundle domain-containing protein n=1 Tax=Kingdonia uniflora TaxID=39325 RepID=A0A7J7LDL9_9MAGN|nr:hypothetical protein GIB67_035142 [Kingdonia uniflora]
METFPSKSECTVLSALLLLSSSTPFSLSSNTHQQSFGFGESWEKVVEEGSDSIGDLKSSCSSFGESFSNIKALSSSACDLKSSSASICLGEISSKIKDRSTSLSDLKSSCCSSSVTTVTSDDGSMKRSRSADQLRILSVAARVHDLKLKVVRRSRTKHYYYKGSDRRKGDPNEWRRPVATAMETEPPSSAEAASSSSASGIYSGAPSQYFLLDVGKLMLKREKKREIKREKIGSDSGYMRRRADAILKFLSVGCASEVRIREVLGDSPDTSKALRMLLKQAEVKRSGRGGSKDPFVYAVVGSRSDVDSV